MMTTHNCVFGTECPYPHTHDTPPRSPSDEAIFSAASDHAHTLYQTAQGIPLAALPLLAAVLEDAALSAWAPATPDRNNLKALALAILGEVPQ